MCIAIFSPKGNEVPSEQYLKMSFENNPDGAGFAYNTGTGKVHILKGFMTWDSFISAFNEYKEKQNFKEKGVLIHFRIQTHGGKVPECTHPFPLVDREGGMKKLDCLTDYAVIHNGVISLTSPLTYARHNMSDTMVFIEKYMSKLASNKSWFYNKTNFELIHTMINSKMAVLNSKGQIKSTEGFTQDADGNFYSNNSYKETRVKPTTVVPSSYARPGYMGTYGNYNGQKTLMSIPNGFKVVTGGKTFVAGNEKNQNFRFFVDPYYNLLWAKAKDVDDDKGEVNGQLQLLGRDTWVYDEKKKVYPNWTKTHLVDYGKCVWTLDEEMEPDTTTKASKEIYD